MVTFSYLAVLVAVVLAAGYIAIEELRKCQENRRRSRTQLERQTRIRRIQAEAEHHIAFISDQAARAMFDATRRDK